MTQKHNAMTRRRARQHKARARWRGRNDGQRLREIQRACSECHGRGYTGGESPGDVEVCPCRRGAQ